MNKKIKTYVITVSRNFMKDHVRAGEPTGFVDAILDRRKIHTIREGAYWKKVVDEINSGLAVLSVRYWTGKPYFSKQTEFAKFEKLGWQDFEFEKDGHWSIDGRATKYGLATFAKNDGLSLEDFMHWFKWPNPFKGGIIHFTDLKY